MTNPFGDPTNAKVLVIGHDPRLQRSETLAEYSFFADYYFRPIPAKPPELRKYDLAASLFAYVAYLTSHRYNASELLITNLCNDALPHAPSGKTVLIPPKIAEQSVLEFQQLLRRSAIELIFPMSQQVNYLLQKFGLYTSTEKYLEMSAPKDAAEYYEPVGKSPFLEICGNGYRVGSAMLFPILHVKHYPLKKIMLKQYGARYEKIINAIKSMEPGAS